LSTDTKQILETALSLPAIDRALIVESLLTSLDQPDTDVDGLWAVEAKDRLAAFDAGRIDAVPADMVFREFDDL
jgi:putative addiction module component (TIGR02574 family)